MRNLARQFFTRGWCRFEHDPRLLEWVDAALPAARACREDPRHARWLRYQGTWFAGVNALPNDDRGALVGSGPLAGDAVDFIAAELGLANFAWDAAHVDGLLREGPQRRRFLREHHGFILGIPMVDFDAGASPFTIWEGSQEIVRDAFRRRFAGIPLERWCDEDVTESYHAARRLAFETCRRVEVHARPGEAYLAHRLSLHGMAPWRDGAGAGADGRMIVYFRPDTFGPGDWLHAP